VHADLNQDHVLGVWEAQHWQPCGVIDFGDALVGDPTYELVALHLGLFRGDKRLLQAFLAAYGDAELGRGLPTRAMAMTLLHEFDLLDVLEPEVFMVETLEELASRIWDISL
jgi:aminoglycoside/choline kinase family phosphotransferase